MDGKYEVIVDDDDERSQFTDDEADDEDEKDENAKNAAVVVARIKRDYPEVSEFAKRLGEFEADILSQKQKGKPGRRGKRDATNFRAEIAIDLARDHLAYLVRLYNRELVAEREAYQRYLNDEPEAMSAQQALLLLKRLVKFSQPEIARKLFRTPIGQTYYLPMAKQCAPYATSETCSAAPQCFWEDDLCRFDLSVEERKKLYSIINPPRAESTVSRTSGENFWRRGD